MRVGRCLFTDKAQSPGCCLENRSLLSCLLYPHNTLSIVSFVAAKANVNGAAHLQAALGATGLGQEGDAVLRRKVLHQLPQREVLLLRPPPACRCEQQKRAQCTACCKLNDQLQRK